jgi:arylsulfatase A
MPGVTDALFSQIDILESLAAFSGYGNPEPLTYDSQNYLSALLGEDQTGRDFVIQQNMNGTLSIIKDNWKYIEPADGPRLNPYTRPRMELGNDPNPQLYNLSQDSTESNNLAVEYPEITDKLAGFLEQVRDKAL